MSQPACHTKSERATDIWQKEQNNKIATGLASLGRKMVVQEHTSEDADGNKKPFEGQLVSKQQQPQHVP